MKLAAFLTASALVVGATCASASAITLDSTGVTWFDNGGGGYNVQYNLVSGTETQVRWGRNIGNGQSGLGFDGVAPPPQTIFLEQEFRIANLRHFNHPISGGSASEHVGMSIHLDLNIPPVIPHDLDFNVAINETPNLTGNDYLDRDFITVPNSYANFYFDIGGTDYTLQITGFRLLDDNGNPTGSTVTTFESNENNDNIVALFGKLTAFFPPPDEGGPTEEPPPNTGGPNTATPEPATAATGALATGVIMAFAARRRRA